jgi:hypothetical protein
MLLRRTNSFSGTITQKNPRKKVRQQGKDSAQHDATNGNQDDVTQQVTATPNNTGMQDNASLLELVKDLQVQLADEKALRKRFALQHQLNPNPDKGILNALPIGAIIITLEELLVKDYPLHLNDLLVKFHEDNDCWIGDFYLGVRRPVGGYDREEFENGERGDDGTHVIEGKFEYDSEINCWLWRPRGEYQELWDVINT